MTGKLENKVAIITGGGTGIGAAIARRFHKAGAQVVVTGRRAAPLEEVAAETGGLAVPGDAAKEADCVEAVRAATERFGGVDIAVANAGVITVGSATTLTLSDWEDTMAINVTGVMQLARASVPAMLARGGGSILNISSVAGLASSSVMASYVASKHAVIGLTKTMAIDYGPHDIRVNTLCPGWVETPMSEDALNALAKAKNLSYEEMMEKTVQYLPLKRMAKPDEIAACAEFLTSDDASFVTGATLVADGGGQAVDVGAVSFL